jgi:hypothetical protein
MQTRPSLGGCGHLQFSEKHSAIVIITRIRARIGRGWVVFSWDVGSETTSPISLGVDALLTVSTMRAVQQLSKTPTAGQAPSAAGHSLGDTG